MLVANRKSGKKLSLADRWDKQELSAIRSKEGFYCPECKEEVILKLGSKRIWHFSHQPGSNCESQYERESEYHMSGKLQLYEWLANQGIEAELEQFDPEIRQRPDIAFSFHGKKYALEFQCSPIPEELLIKRTNRYLQNGYIPIWIAAASLISRPGGNAVSISDFLYLFLRRSNGTLSIPAYCPVTKQFIYVNHPLPISARRALARLEIQPLHTASAAHLVWPSAPVKPFVSQWKSELRKMKTKLIAYPGSFQNVFLRELYANHLNIQTLPPEIGLPVLSSPHIMTAPLIWQSYLYLDVFRHLKKGGLIDYQVIRTAFMRRVSRQQIRLRKLPADLEGNSFDALGEYLEMLVRVSFFKKTSNQTFKLLREMEVPETFHDQIQAEDLFYQKYGMEIEAFFKSAKKLAGHN